jgi:hypothetical protein
MDSMILPVVRLLRDRVSVSPEEPFSRATKLAEAWWRGWEQADAILLRGDKLP